LVITLGLVVISSAMVALAQQPPGNPADVSARDIGPLDVRGNCFAVVNANGTAVRTNCVVRTALLATGQYEVIFNGNVGTCTFLATIGIITTGISAPGQIDVATRAGNPNGVFVATRSNNGSFANRPFHLGILCR
jgi:hypothetical protein